MNQGQPMRTVRVVGVVALTTMLAAASCGPSKVPPREPAPEPAGHTFTVDTALRPPVASVTGPHGTRVLAAMRDEHGTTAAFFTDELVVRVPAGAAGNETLRRLDGTVLERLDLPPGAGGGAILLVRVRPAEADPARLRADAAAVATGGGAYAVSSPAALNLLALAYHLRATGTAEVDVNVVAPGAGVVEDVVARRVRDHDGTDANDVSYLKEGGPQDIGVTTAWRQLALAGRLTNTPAQRIRVAVLDGGFTNSPDLPPRRLVTGTFDAAGWTKPNPSACGSVPCPWHGADVAHALAALPGNGRGAAGPAGPVAELALLQHPSDFVSGFSYLGGLILALGGNQIVNMSFRAALPFVLFPLIEIAATVTAVVRAAGTLIFAAAGNDGTDVDADVCFPGCFETAIVFPCELAGVICVGGLAENSSNRARNSNHGRRDGGHDRQTVDIFGPYTVLAPSAKETGTGAVKISGTSFATPFVAGVAALVWAADPARSANDVESILLRTAHTGPVGRWVDAAAAVTAALGRVCEPPRAQIRLPEPDAVVAVGDPVTLRGHGTDGTTALPDPALSWAVDGKPAGTGRELSRVFTTAGRHTITLRVTGCSAVPALATVTVTARDVPKRPGTAAIRTPADGATVTATGVELGPEDFRSYATVQLTGHANYPDGTPVPAERLRWRSSVDGPLGTGSPVQVRLHGGRCTSAVHVVTLEALDADGRTVATDTARLTIGEAPC